MESFPFPADCSRGENDSCRITHESGRVVVSDGLGVSERLEERVGLEDDVLDLLGRGAAAGHLGEVVHDELGRDGLAGAGFAAEKNVIEGEILTLVCL